MPKKQLRPKNEDYNSNDNRNKKKANQPGSKLSPLFQDFNPYGDSHYSQESDDASHLVTQDMDTGRRNRVEDFLYHDP